MFNYYIQVALDYRFLSQKTHLAVRGGLPSALVYEGLITLLKNQV